MTIATLADIITKIRRLTGSANNLQLTDSQIKDYINSFYLYDMPAEFRNLKIKDIYTFNTQQGIDKYDFDSEKYTTVEMPAYVAKREVKIFYDPWSFYGSNFNWQSQENFTTGNGTAGPYSGITVGHPLIRSDNNNPTNINFPAGRVQNILITANINYGFSVNVTDDPITNSASGNLIQYLDNGTVNTSGTINYQTGQISGLSFVNPSTGLPINIPQGNPINIQYDPQVLAIPLSIMFFQNQFTMRPVPDKGYTVEMVAYRQPTQALEAAPANTGVPELKEWWELLCFGASKKIYQDRLDTDGVALMEKWLEQCYSIVRTRTYGEIGKQRINTLFADQLQYNYGSSGWGFGIGP